MKRNFHMVKMASDFYPEINRSNGDPDRIKFAELRKMTICSSGNGDVIVLVRWTGEQLIEYSY